MPYQVQQLLEGKSEPVCVTKEDSAAAALRLMIENDFSQLPVVKNVHKNNVPEGMVTHEAILRGILNFKTGLDTLKVRDVLVSAPTYSVDDDLFDILDRLKDTNAVLIVDGKRENLVGIVTSYDTTEYFRNRTEDLMRVEDIEFMIKEFVKTAYTHKNGEINENLLEEKIAEYIVYKKEVNRKEKTSFDDLNLSDYIGLLFTKETWAFLEPIFQMPKNSVSELLQEVRKTRNLLMHFRGEISAEQRDTLKFCMEWLTRCQEEYQARKEAEGTKEAEKEAKKNLEPGFPKEISWAKRLDAIISSNYSTADSSTGSSRYAALADWLQSQPGRIDQVPLSFNQIEEIIGSDLPPSARIRRVWWANDSIGHSHSQLWLEAGWRTTYVNLTEGKVTFSRVKEREKAYIAFFSKLLTAIRTNADFPIKDVSPDGTNWLVVQTISPKGKTCGYYTFNFTRDKRFRVEIYLDLGDQTLTKEVFDRLQLKRDLFESQIGPLTWERLDNRRASRIAIYHDGSILDEKNHRELIDWAAKNMAKLYNAFNEPVSMVLDD